MKIGISYTTTTLVLKLSSYLLEKLDLLWTSKPYIINFVNWTNGVYFTYLLLLLLLLLLVLLIFLHPAKCLIFNLSHRLSVSVFFLHFAFLPECTCIVG